MGHLVSARLLIGLGCIYRIGGGLVEVIGEGLIDHLYQEHIKERDLRVGYIAQGQTSNVAIFRYPYSGKFW